MYQKRRTILIAKYKKWLEPEGLALLKGMARDGLSDEQIAHNICVSEHTLNRWKKDFPEISQALQYGKEAADYMVEDALFQSGLGYHVTETTLKTNQAGDVTTVEKDRYISQKPAAAIFWLKHRMPGKWGDQPTEMAQAQKPVEPEPIDFSGMNRFVRWVLNPENTMPYSEYTEDEETAERWCIEDALAALWGNQT